ncbi:hypothetical protein PI124_g24801 [Phytophthora idaei]|nr:hypothetical protein PI126_g24862 [Phytophthora idaei]KAG3230100.1 hypothetical protein PI124_g24801 [Phytophthora idaei]
MQRLLNELDFHYVVGKKRHILADMAAVVSLRGIYIEYKLSNRRPTRQGKTWLLDDKIRYNKSGKGPRKPQVLSCLREGALRLALWRAR